MAVQPDDINIVFSGGASNISSDLSIGGDPSIHPVFGTNNNLFSNVSTSDAINGFIDYRCIYVFNENDADSLTNTSIYVESENSNNITMGVQFAQDIQTITISGFPTGGSFVIKYNLTNITSNWNWSIDAWATELQSNLVSLVPGTTVSGSQGNGITIFTINLGSNTYYPILELVSDSLTGDTSIVITKLNNGTPINSITPSIPNSTSAPININFTLANTENTAINIGNIGPGDGFPIWFQRTIAPNTGTIIDDGFNLRIVGDF